MYGPLRPPSAAGSARTRRSSTSRSRRLHPHPHVRVGAAVQLRVRVAGPSKSRLFVEPGNGSPASRRSGRSASSSARPSASSMSTRRCVPAVWPAPWLPVSRLVDVPDDDPAAGQLRVEHRLLAVLDEEVLAAPADLDAARVVEELMHLARCPRHARSTRRTFAGRVARRRDPAPGTHLLHGSKCGGVSALLIVPRYCDAIALQMSTPLPPFGLASSSYRSGRPSECPSSCANRPIVWICAVGERSRQVDERVCELGVDDERVDRVAVGGHRATPAVRRRHPSAARGCRSVPPPPSRSRRAGRRPRR